MKRHSRQRVWNRGDDAGTLNTQRHFCARVAAKHFRGLFQRPSFGGVSVDLGDAVARLNARALCRASRHRRNHHQPTVAHVHLDSDAGVVSARGLVQPAELVRGQKRGVWILELVQHAFNCFAVKQLLSHRVDVELVYVSEHLVEQTLGFGGRRGGVARPANDQPATSDERCRENCGHGDGTRAKLRCDVELHATSSRSAANRSGIALTRAATTRPKTSSRDPVPSTLTTGPHSGCSLCHTGVVASANARSTRA